MFSTKWNQITLARSDSVSGVHRINHSNKCILFCEYNFQKQTLGNRNTDNLDPNAKLHTLQRPQQHWTMSDKI